MHNSPGSIAAGLHVRTLGAFWAVSPIKIVYHEDLEIKEPPEAVSGSDRFGVSRPTQAEYLESSILQSSMTIRVTGGAVLSVFPKIYSGPEP